jgi:ATP-binding cassette subfamily B protein
MLSRYAHVRQLELCDCGTAALATVALHHRVPTDLLQLRRPAGTGSEGTNFQDLVRAARELGFSARAVRGPFEALPQVPLPSIAHTENETGLGHFVVLHQVDANSVIVADPAAHVERLSKEQFCRAWTGCLLILQRDRAPGLDEIVSRATAAFRDRVKRSIDFARFAVSSRTLSGGRARQ